MVVNQVNFVEDFDSSENALHKALLKTTSVVKIQEIINNCPDCVSCRDINGNLPIHNAISSCQDLSVISYLANIYPEGLRATSRYGCLPIHKALYEKQVPSSVIIYLANRNPESIRVVDSFGFLPLHHACTCNKYSDVIPILIDLYFEGLIKQNTQSDHKLPIHLAITDGNIDGDTVLYIANQCPASLQIQDSFKKLPLHYACTKKIYEMIVLPLIELYPESLMVGSYDDNNSYINNIKTQVWNLPIFPAIKYGLNSNILLNMAIRCPESLKLKDGIGNLPFHYICHRLDCHDIVPSLIKMHPDSLITMSADGRLPIYVAIEMNMNVEVILYMASFCPRSLSQPYTANGSLPLHLACAKSEMNDSIPMLVDIYPDGLLVQRFDGKLPLHVALMHGKISNDIILYMSSRSPNTLRVTDSSGMLPIHYACSLQYCDLVSFFADMYVEGLTLLSAMGKTPIQTALNQTLSSNIIKYLASLCPFSLSIKDSFGCLPLHYACLWSKYGNIIPVLVDLYPDALLVKSQRNLLPIHIACQNALLDDKIVIYLAMKCPNSLLVDDLPIHLVLSFRPIETQSQIVPILARLNRASISAVSLSGENALDLAMWRGKNRLVYRILLNICIETASKNTLHHLNRLDLNWKASQPLILSLSRIVPKSACKDSIAKAINSIGCLSRIDKNCESFVFLWCILSFL